MPENKIYLLSKCVERRFAEMLFYEGIIHFGYPSRWIEEGMTGNVGQGDELEGVYSNEITFKNVISRRCPRLVRDKETGTKYLRTKRIVNWPCYCLYSVSDQTPYEWEGDTMIFDMSEAYAQDFADGETWKTRFDTAFEDRKAMVVIHRPMVFLDKVKDFFEKEKGLVEGRDYFMGLVHYRKAGEKFTYKKTPDELFHKDARFNPQQEYRIALNPESRKVKGLLDEHQNVSIGSSLEDCAMLKSHFYKGARILVKDDEVKRLEIRDMSNLSGPLHEMEFVPLMNLLGATYNFKMKCTLNGREAVAYELMEEIRKVMNNKYHTVWAIVDEEGHGRMMQLQSGYGIGNIEKNEEKDSGFYMRNYKGYKAPAFEALYVWNSGEWTRYKNMTYDIEGLIGPLVRRDEG